MNESRLKHFAIVFTKLYYCSSVWANTSKRNVTKLQSIQNIAGRIVTGTRKYDHVTPSLQKLHWLPVCYTLRYRDTVLAFKCLKGCAPQCLSGRFTQRSEIHNRATRHRNTLEIPSVKLPLVSGPQSRAFPLLEMF